MSNLSVPNIGSSGQTFGKLKVIKQKPNSKKGEWLCECECGKQLFVRTDCLLLRDKRGSGCKNCLWKGYGEISGTYWNMIISRQKYYDTKFDITIEFAWNLFLKQDRKCAISGLPLCFVRSYDAGKTKDQTASLDRKNSKLGYMIDNVQWVHKDVNKMKQNFSDKYFLEICNKVSKYNESK